MANDISANPWKLDTAGVGIIYAFPIKIITISWGNYTTAGDTLLIQDVNGKDIVNAAIPAASALQPLSFGPFLWVRGLKLITITHGEVTIGIGAGK